MKKKLLLLSLILTACGSSNAPIDLTVASSDKGALTIAWMPKEAVDNENIYFGLRIPFRRITAPLANQAATYFNELDKDRETQPPYHLFANVDFPTYLGEIPPNAVAINDATGVVDLSSFYNQGIYSERDFQSGKVMDHQSSLKFGDDLSIRYLADKTGAAAFGLCLNLPGENFASPTASIPYLVTNEITGALVSASSVDSIISATSFEYIRGCYRLMLGKIGAVSSDLKSQTTTKNAEYDPFQVDLPPPESALTSPLQSFYAHSFAKQKAGEKASQEELEEYRQSFLDGSWVVKSREKYLNGVGFKLQNSLNEIVHRIGVPETGDQLHTVLHDQCRLLRFSESKDWTDDLESFCKEDVDRTVLAAEYFNQDKETESNGCYRGFVRLFESLPVVLDKCPVDRPLSDPPRRWRRILARLAHEVTENICDWQRRARELESGDPSPFDRQL